MRQVRRKQEFDAVYANPFAEEVKRAFIRGWRAAEARVEDADPTTEAPGY
jgi:hypothetical protein